MVPVPIPPPGQSSQIRYPQSGMSTTSALSTSQTPTTSQDLTNIVAAGTLIAGGALIVAGHKRAGLALAAAGTALALLEEQEAIQIWWKNLPGYLREAQLFLDKVEGYMNAAATQGHKLQNILRREV